MKKLIALFIVAALFSANVNAQRVDRSKFISDSLQNYISRAMTNWRIPGAAVCIIKDGKIIGIVSRRDVLPPLSSTVCDRVAGKYGWPVAASGSTIDPWPRGRDS